MHDSSLNDIPKGEKNGKDEEITIWKKKVFFFVTWKMTNINNVLILRGEVISSIVLKGFNFFCVGFYTYSLALLISQRRDGKAEMSIIILT